MNKLYGSLQNRLQERSSSDIIPEVGMGATELCYSDRHAYEITKIIDARHILVRRLDYKRTDTNGISEIQEYEFTSNSSFPEETLFKTHKGKWKQRIGSHGEGNVFLLGVKEEYRDPTF